MKYKHNGLHDNTVGEIVRGDYTCDGFTGRDCNYCPIQDKCANTDNFNTEKTKQAVIEYIAEDVAEFWESEDYHSSSLSKWLSFKNHNTRGIKFSDKYPVDEQTAKEIADAARVLLEGGEHDDAYEKIQKAIDDTTKMFSASKPSLDELRKYYQQPKNEMHPKTADVFFVYNADGEKCATVCKEENDDHVAIAIQNEMDITTACVFCEKLSSFLRSIDGIK